MNLATLFFTVSISYHLPFDVLPKVCFVESAYNKNIITTDSNGLHSIGMCQIQLRTARALGFKGSEKDLLDPKTNAEYAGAYLAHQFDRYGSWIKAIKAYNAGFARSDRPNSYSKKVSSVDIGDRNLGLLTMVE